MSKFDKLFNKPTPTTYNNGSFGRPNSFIIKEKVMAKFDYKEEAFPDLLVCNNKVLVSDTKTKKYSDITSTVNEVKKIEDNLVPPGWTQFTRTKGNWKFDIVHGEKTKRQLEQEQEKEQEKEQEARINNPEYIYNKLITTLSNNWLRYKIQYDSIHGEGAYDLIYYLEPIYFEDEKCPDGISNNNDYSYDNSNEYSSSE